jgi:predicted Zn-dependent protease
MMSMNNMSSPNTWHGSGLFFDSQGTDSYTVDVNIVPDGITIVHDATKQLFAWHQLRMTTAGSGYVRIELKNTGSVLSLQSVEALNALAANHHVRKGMLGRLTPNQQVLWGTIAFIIIAGVFFTVGLDLLANAGTKLISLDMEKKLGSVVMDGMVANEQTAQDSAVIRVLEKCAAIVAGFDGPTNEVAYNISLIENKDIVNAFALPGGYIVIYRGMMDKLENESELFGLLGHEVGHVALRHGVRRIIRSAVLGIITSILVGDAGGVTSVLLENGNMLVSLSYDRQEELDADMFGLKAVERTDVDAQGIVTLFEKLQKAEGSSEWLTFLSTHPDTEERLRVLRAKLPKQLHTRKRLTDEEWKILTSSPLQP